MEWVELVVPCAELADEVAALLAEMAAGAGLEVRAGEIVAWARADEAAGARAQLAGAVARLRDGGFAVDPAAIAVRPAAREDEWRDAWKRYFTTTRIGRRMVIVPSWETYAPAPGDVVLELDPGRAFGTGAHASTRLCLMELEDVAGDVRRFLDVGTGSGILAIAAAKLWPRATGVAIDVDPIAVAAAGENLARNGIDRVTTSDRALEDVDGRFDLVLGNIQADVLEQMGAALAARTAGRLILSGLLLEQVGPIRETFARTGLRVDGVRALDEWAAVVMTSP
ncbi:MAG TPA: 50S ribosomal protein L11 methyltransferase [Haliangiales bacterium]|nr:50S ribosomal protein L11 methyltransferase [Haliangiales bacterium]